MMELECFLSAIGMAKSIIVLISSSLDQQIVDSVVHSTLWPWKSSCKILCKVQIICFHYKFFNHFSIGGSAFIGGIENVYHDPCQDWLDLINMKLTSPNYPEPFKPLEHCNWRITAPPGHYVTLEFHKIDVSSIMFKRIQILKSLELQG